MSQNDILMILYKNRKKWFSAKDIYKEIPIGKSSISKSMKQLIKFNKAYGLDFKKEKFNKFFVRKR